MRHSLFANITTNIFWVLAVIYAIKFIMEEQKNYKILDTIINKIPATRYVWLTKIMKWIDKLYIPFVLSLVGLFAVSITGAL